MKSWLSLLCAWLFFVVVPAISSAQEQPVFKLPFYANANAPFPNRCTQGNHGSTSHDKNSTEFALDFDTPNPGQKGNSEVVLAAADGVAYGFGGCVFGNTREHRNCNDGFGNHVKIDHGNGIFSIYAHLETISVQNGAPVRQGHPIGKEGSTGFSFNRNTGGRADHIHFGIQTGDPTAPHPGTSIPLERLEVIDRTENSGIKIVSGAQIICGVPPPLDQSGGHVYDSTNSIPGDLNRDGIVNSIDWSIMNGKWLTNDANADLNKDGIVNSIDFSIMNHNWNRTADDILGGQ